MLKGKGQYNVNISSAEQNGISKGNSDIVFPNVNINQVDQVNEMMLKKKWNLFSTGVLESFFDW